MTSVMTNSSLRATNYKKMSRIIPLTVFNFFISWFIIINLINITKEESPGLNNQTQSDIHNWKSGISKRSLYRMVPLHLKMTIQNEIGQLINLKWKKQPHSLANINLPITLSDGYPIRNVMNDIGAFVVYHDLPRCSAIIYFDKTKTLSGNIGLEFTIIDLPYEFDTRGNYIGREILRYIKKRQNTPLHNLPQIPDIDLNDLFVGCDHNPHDNTNSQLNPQPGPSWMHRKKRDFAVEVKNNHWRQMNSSEFKSTRERRENSKYFQFYYLEVLVFVTHDVTVLYKSNQHLGNDHISSIVKDYIIYFNTIDMFFQQLETSHENLQLNIAKIVIEDSTEEFDVFTNDGELLFEETVNKRRENLESQQIIYPKDSYDHVFISTNRKIKANSINVPGATDYEEDLYTARRHGRWFEAVPVTIMGFYEDPVLTVHEIGRTLNINVDPWNKGHNIAGQCYGIMQEGSSKCPNCLKWSLESSEQFKLFFRKNRNRCFLLNTPRSLRRKSVSQFFTLATLCKCFGYDSVMKGPRTSLLRDYLQQEKCDKPLQCSKVIDGMLIHEETLAPFDGALCGGRIRACWNGRCTRITYGYSYADSRRNQAMN